jgi:Right handed beta helix region
MIRILFSLVLMIATPALADAATYYVSPTGTNAACRSITGYANGKTTIAAGLACMEAGDTLNIGDGTYAESIAAGAIPSGASDANRTIIQAQTNRAAILRPTTISQCAARASVLRIRNQSNITITGLYLDANNICPNGLVIDTSTTGEVSNNITFQDGQVEDCKGTTGGTGCVAGGMARPYQGTIPTNIRILSNIIQRMGLALEVNRNHCIYAPYKDSLFEGNTISDCYGSGYTMHANSGDRPGTATVRGNWVENCMTGAGIRLAGQGSKAYNNVVKGCGNVSLRHSAISIHLNDADDNEADNNTIINSAYGCMMIRATSRQTSSGNKLRNNICFGGTTTIRDEGTSSTITNNRCDRGCSTSADPLFADPDNNDYTLHSSSTMIDGGAYGERQD